ncbi:MAG: NAD-dependent epimerase/dehydratase family protein [Breznakia sp.]
MNNEDIVLKSEGKQLYSYIYVADAVSGILKLLFDANRGEAYNLSNPQSDITIKNLAFLIAKEVNREVVFELPDEIEKVGYSTATKAVLRVDKLNDLGWKPLFTIQTEIAHTIAILKQCKS